MTDNASTRVRIVNNGRRPLVLRCPGQTLRLAAGDVMDVAESWLRTSELRALHDSGLVSVLATAPAESAAATAAAGANRAPAEEPAIPVPPAREAVRKRARDSTEAAAGYAGETRSPAPASAVPTADNQQPE
jgi:hypothetical protein